MIKEAFLVCALALPVTFSNGNGGNEEQRESFLREYKWIHDLLERSYPSHEFLIIPEDIATGIPPGWTEVGFQWRSHRIYKRTIDVSA